MLFAKAWSISSGVSSAVVLLWINPDIDATSAALAALTVFGRSGTAFYRPRSL
jgi:hypothetical protein